MQIRKLIIMIVAMLPLASCIKNDLMYPDIQACITTFSVEGQTRTTIFSSQQKVEVTVPTGTDVTALKITGFAITDGATVTTNFPAVGETVNLTDTLRVTLHLYRDYEWKIYAVKSDEGVDTKPQLYNMSFDEWTLDGKAWYLYGANASDAQKNVWGTANKGTSILGKSTTSPEETFVAVKGTGKKAAKLISTYLAVKFAAGNLFNGQFVGLKGFTGAELAWGTPFTAKPKSLHGYYCYQGATINYADNDHASLKGTMDEGHIMILLTDWDAQFHVISTDKQFVDTDNDPNIIGYADLPTTGYSDKYTEFTLPITYRNSRTPKWVVIVAASSKNGDYFTGGEGSTLYLDEFEFIY
jgi:hypothetical protein